MENLTKASHKLAEEIYKQAAAKQQGQAKTQESENREQNTEGAKEEKPKKEDIIDAEYKAEDDEDKDKK